MFMLEMCPFRPVGCLRLAYKYLYLLLYHYLFIYLFIYLLDCGVWTTEVMLLLFNCTFQ